MVTRRILLIQGHPDIHPVHLGHTLEDAYALAARQAGHQVRRVSLSSLDFPGLQNQEEWETGQLPSALEDAQADIAWAEHIVLFFPLWLGDMPALVKAFLEQVARPGFAFQRDRGELVGRKLLTGRSARVVVTMGMPAPVYRWYFGQPAVQVLRRHVFGFVGIAPVRVTLLGGAGHPDDAQVARWLSRMGRLGARGI